MRRATRLILTVLAAQTAVARPAAAQDSTPLAGFSEAGTESQRDFESALKMYIWPDTSARYAIGLSSSPHVAGTPGQVATRDSVVGWLRTAGLEVSYDTLVLYLPQPIAVEVARLSPEPMAIEIREPAIPGISSTEEQVPVFNAYSGNGVVEGEVVYVNHGLPTDYRLLDSLGVRVEGRIAVARYGRSFRGIKAREATKRGAAALLMYSDPAADGFEAGEVYPDGPFRPALGVQRGSILNANGDPSTPDGPSLPGAERVSEAEMVGIGRIPVVPIGYGPAGELLAGLEGPPPPAGWEGGLPIEYRLGPGPVTARVRVRTERGDSAYHPAFNTIAVVRGSEWPDEWVIVGGHRDAWGPGAIDDVSGTASVVAAGRAFGELAARGMRPRRSVLFATWDAEEWGILGSIEWVEAHAARIRGSAVAYLNQDSGVSGRNFGASASPELKSLVRAVTQAVDEPTEDRSVYDGWLAEARLRADEGAPAPAEPAVGNLGGGSDHKGFYQHLGIPSAGFGFGGRSGVYHSMYDTPDWMQRFGDPGYRYHATVARILAIMTARIANADILPFDHVGMGRTIADQVDDVEREIHAFVAATVGSEHESDRELEIARRLDETGMNDGLRRARSAVAVFADRAVAVEEAVGRRLAAGDLDAEHLARVNEALRRIGPALTSNAGVPGDPWSRQLVFASDPDNGYATLPLPSVRLALRSGVLPEVAARLEELADAVDTAADLLISAGAVAEDSPASPGGS